MKIFISIFLILAALYAGATVVKEMSVLMKVPDGEVDFTLKEISLTAAGAPGLNIKSVNTARINAAKAAEKNLSVRLETALSKMILSRGKSVEKYLSEKKDSVFMTNLVKNDKSGEVVSSRYYSDGSVELFYKIPLEKFIQEIKIKASADFCTDSVTVINYGESVADETKADVLVVEITDSRFVPSLFISIESEEGEIFFNSCGGEGDVLLKSAGRFIRKKPDHFLNELNGLENHLAVKVLRVKDGSRLVLKKNEIEKIAQGLKKEVLNSGRIIFLIK